MAATLGVAMAVCVLPVSPVLAEEADGQQQVDAVQPAEDAANDDSQSVVSPFDTLEGDASGAQVDDGDAQGELDSDDASAVGGVVTPDDSLPAAEGEPAVGDVGEQETGESDEAVATPAAEDQSTLAQAEVSATDGVTPQAVPEHATEQPSGASDDSLMNMYRLYNPNSGEHFYTSNMNEAKSVANAGWRWEGIGWVSQKTGESVYRLYNPFAGDHHYTVSTTERDNLVSLGWRDEGVGWYSGGIIEVLREYNPNAKTGSHNFTKSSKEHDALVKAGWRDEGTAWLASDNTGLPINGFWLICNSWGKVERYWVGSDGKIAVDRIVTPAEGAGYHAYATKNNGAVLRGASDLDNGTVMLADNDGRLATGSGFVNSSSYGVSNATYYLKDTGSGYSLAQSGHFTVGNDHYWGQAKTAAVLKGKLAIDEGMIIADKSTGKLAWTNGWMITSAYDGSMQRYYLQKSSKWGVMLAKLGLFAVDGKRYYGLEDVGYVARNLHVNKAKGYLYLCDNDGVLENDGWVITSKYAGQLQRYYVNPKAHAVIFGHNEVDGKHYFSLPDVGYVVRGKQKVGKGLVFADNEGSMTWHKGWLITDKLAGTIERYYFDEVDSNGLRGALTGVFSVDGKRYYGREDTGYVVRGVYVISRFYGDSANAYGDVWHDDVVAIGDNDGVLMSRAEFGEKIVRIARTQIGASYTTEDNAYYPYVAFNCSGLSYWVYDQMGVHIPHNQGYHSYYYQQENLYNSQMYSVEKRGGWKSSTAGLQPGDLVFFSPVGDKYRTGHVGVYIGNDQMIDCSTGGCYVRNVYGTNGFVGGGFPITLV